MNSRVRKFLRSLLKITAWILGIFIGLLLMVTLLVRIPAVQKRLVNEAEKILENKLNTQVDIGGLYVNFPTTIELAQFYIEDNAGDTLLAFDALDVDADLWALLNKTIEINSLELNNAVGKLRKPKGSSYYNYQFIIDALAPEDSVASNPEAKPWNFNIENIRLGPVDFSLIDTEAGLELSAKWELVSVDIEKLDLGKTSVDIAELALKKVRVHYDQSKQIKEDSATAENATELPDIKIGEVAVEESSIRFSSSSQNVGWDIGNLVLLIDDMDLPSSIIALEKLELERSSIRAQRFGSSGASPTENEATPWEISLTEALIDETAVKIDLDTNSHSGATFNPNHIDLRQLSARFENISYNPALINASVQRFNLYSDDHLLQASGKFTMNDSSIQLNDGKIRLDQSEVNLTGELTSPSEQLLSEESRVQLDLDETELFLTDLNYLLPEVNNIKYSGSIDLTGQISGTLADLEIRYFNLEMDSTTLSLQGKLYRLDQIENLKFSMDQFDLISSQKAILNLLPDSLQPMPFTLPSTFTVRSKGQGSLRRFRGEVELLSSIGNLKLDVDSLVLADSIPAFALKASTNGFNAGSLIDLNGDLDSVAFGVDISGVGMQPTRMKSNLNGIFKNVRFNEYNYDSISANVKLINGLFDGSLAIIDPNLSVRLTGDGDVASKPYTTDIRLSLDKINLEALNFSNRPLELEGLLATKFSTLDFKRFNGDLAIRDFKANNGIDTYKVDSLLVASIDQEGKTEISIDSDIMEGSFKGNIDLFTVSKAIMQHIDQYYTIAGLQDESIPAMNFTFDFDLKQTDLITEIIVPQLSELDPGYFSAQFNSVENKLDVDLSIHHLNYRGVNVDSFKLVSSSTQNKLTTAFTIDRIRSANTEVNNLALNTALRDNELGTELSLIDSAGTYKYLIKGTFQSMDSIYQFRLNQDSLILAYEKWNVEQNRPFLLDPSGNNDNVNLKISHQGQAIEIETTETDPNLNIGFTKFQLATLGKALQQKDELLSGELNGKLTLLLPDSTVDILADITIDQLSVLRKKWGDFVLNIEPQDDFTYAARLKLISSKNDVEVKAVYDPANLDDLEVTLDIEKFQLATLAPILRENVKELSGVISGQTVLKDGFSRPNLNGSIQLSEVKLNPVALNNTLSIDEENITIKNSTFVFNKFKFADQQKNRAFINGNIKLVEPAFYYLDMSVTTDDFLILNTTQEDNNLFYGTVRTNGKATITGSTARPDVQLNLKLSDDTELTYVVPETEYNNISNDGIVQFVSVKEEEPEKPEDTLSGDSLDFEGLNLITKLEIDKSSKFTIVIDPITEDQLIVQGAATLNLNVNRKGDIELSGRYTVDKGSYNFSFYKLLKREFSIEKGSSITWSGDPYEALMDIRASNRVEAPPIDLMITQIQNTSGSNLERYKQRLPFLVYLGIRGELMKPEISFELDMPQDRRNVFGGAVYARILDLNTRESDLNKQVFALLLLQRFISEDPLRSEAGYDVEDRARRSVSRILSDQLNRLTDNIEGLNLSFDLQSYEDYSSGSAEATTQLELGVSKTLFDDKLEVKVSGNVNLEGQRQQGFADYIGDLALEYKITEDGRLRITGFRRSDFDVLSGEIVETGAGVIYVRDYNTFKELFKKRDGSQ